MVRDDDHHRELHAATARRLSSPNLTSALPPSVSESITPDRRSTSVHGGEGDDEDETEDDAGETPINPPLGGDADYRIGEGLRNRRPGPVGSGRPAEGGDDGRE